MNVSYLMMLGRNRAANWEIVAGTWWHPARGWWREPSASVQVIPRPDRPMDPHRQQR